jgi:hypothetical protein
MNEKVHKDELIKEIRVLTAEIGKFNTSDSDRKTERIYLLHKYNDTKDHAQRILGALAELEGVSTSEVYKKLDLNFD